MSTRPLPFKRGDPLRTQLLARSANQMTRRSPEIGDCLVWTGYRDRQGYGHKKWQGRMWVVHRLAYQDAHGPLPAGVQVLHRCDNPPCFRLDHLFLGDNDINTADRDAKGRNWNRRKTACSQGHPFDAENTYWNPRGSRTCRECSRRWGREFRARQSAVVLLTKENDEQKP